MGASKMEPIKSYDAKVDSKNRVSIKGKVFHVYYHVEEYEDGRIVLSPRILAKPDEIISSKALLTFKESMENFHSGNVSVECFDPESHPERLSEEDDE